MTLQMLSEKAEPNPATAIATVKSNAIESPWQSLQQTGTLEEIPVRAVIVPKWLPRKYSNLQRLELLTTSIQQKGVVVPILLRPAAIDVAQDVYEVIAGVQRWKAAQKAGLTTIPAVVRWLKDDEAIQYALMENTLRHGLGVLEETESILALLATSLNRPQHEVVNLFHKVAKNPAQLENNEILRQWETVLAIFSALGRNWSSFRSNHLPMLGWPEEIKVAVRLQKIAPSKGRIIARIEDEQQRQTLL